MVKISPDKIVGIGEISRMFGVSRAAVCNWRVRYEDFPSPIANLHMGPIFDVNTINQWADKYRIKRSVVA